MNPKKPRKPCPVCAVVVENLDARFCSNRCQMESQYRAYLERWKRGEESGNSGKGRNLQLSAHVRRYLVEKLGEKCSQCSWCPRHPVTGLIPINIEHLDGNPFNSTEENLTFLCPNCHSLTPTFGNLNKGRGRTKGAVVQREDTALAAQE